MEKFILTQWQKRGLFAWLMSPLSLCICVLAQLKRWAYQSGILKQHALSVPVIVVGNISVGGTGKSPLVAHIAQLLQQHNFKPGIICRGYKGKADTWPQFVKADSQPDWVGDEPVMLAMQTHCPVMAGPDKVQAAQALIKGDSSPRSKTEKHGCDVIISDDGFQHLRLARDIDVVVLGDMGNGWCIPAGPLREAKAALSSADICVIHRADNQQDNQRDSAQSSFEMALASGEIYALDDQQLANLSALKQTHLHAVAGIGRPERFFEILRGLGLSFTEHIFADHHDYIASDVDFNDNDLIITTEKDAIKLARLQGLRKTWVLPVKATLSSEFDQQLLKKLNA
ncbi:MAG: tetraacyldisaccharide 4'-kinase [Arenicellales bacterium]